MKQNFGSRAIRVAPGQAALHYCEWIAFVHRDVWGTALDAFGEFVPSLIRLGTNSSERRHRRQHPNDIPLLLVYLHARQCVCFAFGLNIFLRFPKRAAYFMGWATGPLYGGILLSIQQTRT